MIFRPLLRQLLLIFALVQAQEYVSSGVQFDTTNFWNDDRIELISAANYKELIVDQPHQVWLLMLAKKKNDLCLRAVMIYRELADKLHPNVRFGYIDVLQDEGLKVAFGEEAVPFTFGVFGGRAYRYYALERPDEIGDYLTNPIKWNRMPVQFDVPQRPANRLEIVLFDIWKETKWAIKPVLRAYMEWFHTMRTGSPEDFESSTALGFGVLGGAVFLVVAQIYLLKRVICGKKDEKVTTEKSRVKEE